MHTISGAAGLYNRPRRNAMPLVSVVMPCYNGSRFIGEAVDSVRKQTIQDWELLIVDNASTDDSVAVVSALAEEDPRIIPLSCATRGAGSARNAGITYARGRYIAFLDCDDLWSPIKLERQLSIMKETGAVFCWSSYSVIDSSGLTIRRQLATESIDYDSFMSKRSIVGCLTAIYDAQHYGKVYMPLIRMRQDYALWAYLIRNAAQSKVPTVGIKEVLAFYRVHQMAMTRNKIRAAAYQWQLYRNVERLSFLTSLRYFVGYAINGIQERFRR